MTMFLRLGAVVSALLLIPPATAEALVATAASTLFEGLAVILAGAVLARCFPRRWSHVASLAGCGCGSAPAARSVGAAVLTAAAVSPVLALLRFSAAWIVPSRAHGTHDDAAATQVSNLFPAACVAACAAHALPLLHPGIYPPVVAFAAGTLAGIVLAPCGIGAAAILASLAHQSVFAAAGYASTAGIVCFRFRFPTPDTASAADYAAIAVACACVAIRSGASLVHPLVALALVPCSAACAVLAARAVRSASLPGPAALLMLAAALAGGPAPPLAPADAATLERLYEGERVSFTGSYAVARGVPYLTRYRIACCRADATPIAIPLAHSVNARSGEWVELRGTVRASPAGYRVAPEHVRRVGPPADPFVYL